MNDKQPDKTGVSAVTEATQPGTLKGAATTPPAKPALPLEFGGPTGPEPTRYGDWERNGRVSDF